MLETYIGGDCGRTVCKKLGFDNFYIEDARGFSGGIWCLWDKSTWNVDITFHSSQMVHIELKQGQSPPWLLSVIYGSPQRASRRALWNKIRDLSSNINQPWCLIGDFDAILNDFKRKGSARSNPRGACSEFQTCISDCALFDLGYCGWTFTWKRGNLVERLDRALCNLKWHNTFPESKVKQLPSFKSDHSPLCL
ncbi:uncharacterized protein LOC130945532 [Arachis stenosperma]|uniref:uncharacterized protein LOC130945532 n=1 Tax=Arachis stenosperma TaxID=217475 RepID=UPI0025ABFA0E|nr:uncharacterized protein LOC130945532 [Arachis stenosperma]